MLEQIAEILISILLVTAGAFALIGSWGLVRLPSLMTRLHGPTKATTLGVGGFLIVSMIFFPLYEGRFSAHELLITIFLFITAPISANMIAKAHLHRQGSGLDLDPADDVQQGLPEPTRWATFRMPHEPSQDTSNREPSDGECGSVGE